MPETLGGSLDETSGGGYPDYAEEVRQKQDEVRRKQLQEYLNSISADDPTVSSTLQNLSRSAKYETPGALGPVPEVNPYMALQHQRIKAGQDSLLQDPQFSDVLGGASSSTGVRVGSDQVPVTDEDFNFERNLQAGRVADVEKPRGQVDVTIKGADGQEHTYHYGGGTSTNPAPGGAPSFARSHTYATGSLGDYSTPATIEGFGGELRGRSSVYGRGPLQVPEGGGSVSMVQAAENTPMGEQLLARERAKAASARQAEEESMAFAEKQKAHEMGMADPFFREREAAALKIAESKAAAEAQASAGVNASIKAASYQRLQELKRSTQNYLLDLQAKYKNNPTVLQVETAKARERYLQEKQDLESQINGN